MTPSLPIKLLQLKKQALRQRHLADPWRQLGLACSAQGFVAEAIAALEQLTRLEPQNWQAWFLLANQQYAHGSYPQALDHYFKALQLNPGSWEARNNLAVLLKLLGERPLAEQCLREALELKPDYLDALNNLGNLYRDLQRFGPARECFDTALALAPDSAELLTNLGLLHKEQGCLADAIATYRRAVALPQAAQPLELAYNYAIALIQDQQYPMGYAWYEKRWQMPRLAQRRQPYDAAMREWQGEFLGGKTLLLWNEQGLGDMIQMARLIAPWKAAYPDCRVILRVAPALLSLFATLPGVDLLCSSAEAMPRADFHLSVMSLVFRLRIDVDSIPAAEGYLCADPGRDAAWAAHLPPRSGRPRIGIVWQSGLAGVGQAASDRATRSLPPEALGQLLRGHEVDWINLQIDADDLTPDIAGLMHRPVREIGDFADSAAILAQLDGLVSVDTAAAHLGGALGLPTWVLMRSLGGNLFPAVGAQMPWYRRMTLLRQTKLNDWQPVLAQLQVHLAALKPVSNGQICSEG